VIAWVWLSKVTKAHCVTIEECIAHCQDVRRGASNTFCVGDMAFMSYQTSKEDSVRNAGRFLKEAEMDTIKLEGGRRIADKIEAIPSYL